VTDVEIQVLSPDEWRVYRDVRLASLADAPHAFGSTLDRERDLTEADWRGRLTRARTVVGRIDGAVLATATGIHSAKHRGEIELVAVWAHPDARGSGLAARVVGAVLNWAPDRVWTTVVSGNTPAERFYTRLGFRFTGDAKPMPGDPSRIERFLVRDRPR
jgi:RimJ/RimL family protein N-acetyltransferase